MFIDRPQRHCTIRRVYVRTPQLQYSPFYLLSHQDHGIVVLPQRVVFAMVRHSQRLQPIPIRSSVQFTHDQHGLVGGVHFDRRSQSIRQCLNFNLPAQLAVLAMFSQYLPQKNNPNRTHTRTRSQHHKRERVLPHPNNTKEPQSPHTYSSKSPSTKGEKSLGLFFMCAVAIFLISKHALLLLNSSLLRNAN